MKDIRTPTDTDGFDEALSELVRVAVLNDVDVEGGWDVYSNAGRKPVFTVEIYRLDG